MMQFCIVMCTMIMMHIHHDAQTHIMMLFNIMMPSYHDVFRNIMMVAYHDAKNIMIMDAS